MSAHSSYLTHSAFLCHLLMALETLALYCGLPKLAQLLHSMITVRRSTLGQTLPSEPYLGLL